MHDINLIPQAKRNAADKINSQMLFIGLFCFVVMAVFFFYFPLQEKLNLEKKIRTMEEEISSYANIQSEYITLTEQADRLERMTQDLESLKKNKVKYTEVMDLIEECLPKRISISGMRLDAGLLTLEGTSLTYREISQFMVNLRKQDNVLSVTFKDAAAQDEESTGQDQPQDFTIYVNLDVQDIIAEQLNAVN